jgi:hypothetical protein
MVIELLTKGIFFVMAILNDECAKPVMDYIRIRNPTVRINRKNKTTHFVGIIHRHRYTLSFKVIYIQRRDGLAICGCVHKLKFAGAWNDVVR